MKTLWHGGTIYTMEQEGATVEAVLVEADRIVAVGPYEELASAADEQVHLNGATMYPGFVDSHLHMIMQGMKMLRLDLSDVTSSDEMLAKLAAAAEQLDGTQWLFAESWNENQFTDGHIPTLQQLDAVYTGPMLLTRVCHHVVLVNSTVLQMAAIDASQPDPEGGQIGRTNGALNGLFYENATYLVRALVPMEGPAYEAYLKEALQLTVDTMLAMGLTGGHSEEMFYFGHYRYPLAAYNDVIGGQQNFRVNLLRHHEVFESMRKDGATFAEPYVTAGAMKVFADGSFGGSTAALLAPYADDASNSGLLIHTDEAFEQFVQLARQHDEAIAVHMIGDAAAAQVIDLLERYPAPANKRDRLIHLCVFNEELLARIKRLPVVVDIQPAFVPSDFPWVVERLGTARLTYAYAWKTLLEHNILCAIGTDAPIELLCPLRTIYAAVERKFVGQDHEGYLPEQKLTRYEAISLYTVGSAHAICCEHELGKIAPGYYADFSIFDRDLLTIQSEELLQATALKTVVGGKVVYEKASNLL